MRISVASGGKKMKKVAPTLDWSRMLGFEQITEVRQSTRSQLTGPKVGHKVGQKVGNKVGNKVGIKIGQKIGAKQGIKA